GRVVNLLANSMNESVGFTLKTQKKLNLPEGKLYPKITQAKSYKHGNYTVFGRVIEGMDVVDKIAQVPRDQRDNPVEKVEMKKVYLKKLQLK
ncbi:MAG: peptidylprolyl isomerase, partial [Candidatus Kryptonium sp.]